MSDPALEAAVRALAHPGRRAMLRLVWDEERPATATISVAQQHLWADYLAEAQAFAT